VKSSFFLKKLHTHPPQSMQNQRATMMKALQTSTEELWMRKILVICHRHLWIRLEQVEATPTLVSRRIVFAMLVASTLMALAHDNTATLAVPHTKTDHKLVEEASSLAPEPLLMPGLGQFVLKPSLMDEVRTIGTNYICRLPFYHQAIQGVMCSYSISCCSFVAWPRRPIALEGIDKSDDSNGTMSVDQFAQAKAKEVIVSPKRSRRDQYSSPRVGDGDGPDEGARAETRVEKVLWETRLSFERSRFEEYSPEERKLIFGLVDTYDGHLANEKSGDELFHDEDGSIILVKFIHHFITYKGGQEYLPGTVLSDLQLLYDYLGSINKLTNLHPEAQRRYKSIIKRA
jgi:hypothetical protein